MVPYYGDYPTSHTAVIIPINTFDSNDPSASVTVTNLVNTDVHIHKDGGTTQRNNAAGITMTVDFDSITGGHILIIDTSDNTVADFYQAGHEYQVRIEGVTIDGATVNAFVGCFSIERAGGALALIKSATYGLSALQALLAHADYGLAKLVRSTTPANTLSVDANHEVTVPDTQKVDVETIKTQALTCAGGVTFGVYVGGTGAAALASVLGAAVGASISADIAAVKAETAAIVADTNELQTDDYPTSIAAIKSVVDDILLDTGTTLDGKIDTIDGIVDAILIDTAVIGETGAGLTALPWNAAWDAEVQSECTDALNAYDPPTKAELDTAVANVSVDEIQATALADLFNTDSGTTYAAAAVGSVVKEVADNAGGSALTTDAICEAMFTFDATATYATADAGSVVKQIADNAGGSALTEGGIADAVWDELQNAHVGAGTFGEIASEIATIAVDVAGLDGEAMRGTDSAALASVLGAAVGASISADIAAVKGDTAAILTDTGTTLDGLIKDIPTVAEFEARTLIAADYTIVSDLGVVQTADHTAAIADIPTVAEFNARSLVAADYTIVADLGVVQTADHAAAIADIPTVAEFNARSLVAADYTVVADLGVVQTADHTASIAAIKVITDALTAAAAAKLATSAGTIVAGTVSHDNVASTTTVFYCDDITEATADHYNGRIIIFTSGALQYQATAIEDYELSGGEGKFTVTALTEAPADNVMFIIV